MSKKPKKHRMIKGRDWHLYVLKSKGKLYPNCISLKADLCTNFGHGYEWVKVRLVEVEQ